MKQIDFQISMSSGTKQNNRGYFFTVKNFEFAVSKEYDDLSGKDYWIVTELSCGMRLCQEWTRKAAIARTEGLVKRIGIKKFDQEIKRKIAEFEEASNGRE